MNANAKTVLGYMLKPKEQTHITEAYVSSPPAALIVDERGDVFTLGFQYGAGPGGEFAFNVLRNGVDCGEFASRIERRNGKIRIFSAQGWKTWTGRSFL
jgi:hypothetical protein